MPKEVELSPIIIAAAAKGLAKLQGEIEPGTHPIDVTVSLHVQGVITKGEDSKINPPLKVPFERVLAHALLRAKIGRDYAADIVRECTAEALAEADMSTVLRDRTLDAESIIASAKKEHAEALPKTTRAGDVRWAGTCSIMPCAKSKK